MKLPARQLAAVAALALAVISLGVLLALLSADPLMGLFDSGRFSARVMPEPERIPDAELAKLRWHGRILIQPAAVRRQGQSLTELLQWYDLDPRYVEAAVNAEHLDPAHVPAEPFGVVLLNEN
jgi:hypothetical protein